ncbi:hypothetical protein KQ51_01374 [Candidatus Izimaplasma bacterium HR1]|nr:hypothetical protein KQ51_01374 [Candidatus Izimaplasma bacterium HR1]
MRNNRVRFRISKTHYEIFKYFCNKYRFTYSTGFTHLLLQERILKFIVYRRHSNSKEKELEIFVSDETQRIFMGLVFEVKIEKVQVFINLLKTIKLLENEIL